MPFTNAPEPSQDSTSNKARQQRPKDLTDIKERFFLIDHAKLLADTSQGIMAVLDIVEANEFYQSRPSDNKVEASVLVVSASSCEALQKLALTTTRLLGNHAVQEVELLNARSQT